MQRKEHLTVAGRNKAKVVRDPPPPPFQSQNVVKGGGAYGITMRVLVSSPHNSRLHGVYRIRILIVLMCQGTSRIGKLRGSFINQATRNMPHVQRLTYKHPTPIYHYTWLGDDIV